jgi:hypothetical protein
MRIFAVLLTIAVIPLLWRLMLWLRWPMDCLIAGTAAFAFAYRFEREESR